jgi:uncharacterized protein (DUF1697 family)
MSGPSSNRIGQFWRGTSKNSTISVAALMDAIWTPVRRFPKISTIQFARQLAALMRTFIGLLRGINVGGHNKILMSDLRTLCAEIGWSNIQTYIQSGNLIFSATGKPNALEAELNRAIERRFGLSIPVIIRPAADWSAYIQTNPFLAACKKEPHLVMLCLSQRTAKADAVMQLRERAADGERIAQVGDALWIHFPDGIARSKLSPSLLDRSAGSPVTARNWLTVLKLDEMANAPLAKKVK